MATLFELNKGHSKVANKLIYPYGEGVEPPPLDRNLLGGKGKGLAEMSAIGLPVPPGFIITTEVCHTYSGQSLPEEFRQDILRSLQDLEERTGKTYGTGQKPLLVSVRSGARVSMPGMMDTVLNLGLNDETVKLFAESTQNERLAYDSYRRLIMMYGNIVEGISRKPFESVFDVIKMEEGVKHDVEVSTNGLLKAVDLFKQIYVKEVGHEFPQNVQHQLFSAISAVFSSWNSERAILYRKLHGYSDEWGTAVNVVAMVFGNKNLQSATGVGFTRNPSTGEKKFFGEYLLNAQGEDVVAGIRTPEPLSKLAETLPKVYQELKEAVDKLERHYADMQDIEFTIDDGKLYLLQTRSGKRTGFGAIKIAIDMLKEGLIDEKTALHRVEPEQLGQLLAQVFNDEEKKRAEDYLIAKGINAGPGAASGVAAFTTGQALAFIAKGKQPILIREEANPDDFPGMVASEGILTLRGGATSHAAVVARGLGKPCVVGCEALHLNEEKRTLTCDGKTLHEGDQISIDGSTGEVFFTALTTSPSEVIQVLIDKSLKAEESQIYSYYEDLMTLADKTRTLKIRTNADTPTDSAVARGFGAEGIGLCRTEHMFMDADRLNDVRRMFFSHEPRKRQEAIDRLLPHQRDDFIGIFKAMDRCPVCIRLLDPPLHEFMPHTDEELTTLAESMGCPVSELVKTRANLEERNPMLGHRGCRLGIVLPELTKMQVRAILEAAITVTNEGGEVLPEIMVPLVGVKEELEHQVMLVRETAAEVFEEKGVKIPYLVGTMIELPRAALTADEIAETAEFFSFGTNDLTQTTFGISRDDSNKFIPLYIEGVPHPNRKEELMQIIKQDPFQVIDQKGVGQLMEIAVTKGRKVRHDIKLGICGEHGGEPSSVAFCRKLGLSYVSCSPYRVAIARLAAAQSEVKSQPEDPQ